MNMESYCRACHKNSNEMQYDLEGLIFVLEFRSRLGHGHGKTRPGDAAYLWNSWVEILLTYLFHLFIRVTPNRHTCLIKGVLVWLFKETFSGQILGAELGADWIQKADSRLEY